MSVTVKAAVLALIVLLSFAFTIIPTQAEDRYAYGKLEDSEPEDHKEHEDLGRKKPLFQTKFFSDE
ncbi:MAG TPA: hypothetical protein PK286_06810 [Devosia sp.]|nr:hypothetical protein [Devosia sp.]